MSMKLRDFILGIRKCRTQQEQRDLIAKECACIRTTFKDEHSELRHRNVAKLLYIHMLGYPTHFGQMECLKLLASPSFADKRIGYLGIMVLLDERSDVLMLVTNSLKNDLNHRNQYIVGLALCSLGNISSPEISRDLCPEVERLLQSTNSYIRKKAALCAVRVIRKVPELGENFIPKMKGFFNERSHSVLMTGLTMIQQLCETIPSCIPECRQFVPALVKNLRSLALSGYAPEHDVSGVTDPFLQARILRLLCILGAGDPNSSEQMNDILAQVATNTDVTKNVGNAIQYECVKTILGINCESGLRVLAINVLGRFLLNNDNNIRYVALNTLKRVVHVDPQAVQRHRNIVVECLKDHDISIRRRALDLTLEIVNKANITDLGEELVAFLETADREFKPDLTCRIFQVLDKFSPDPQFQLTMYVRVFQVGGEFVAEEDARSFINLVQQAPDIQPHLTHTLYSLLLSLKPNSKNDILRIVALWCVGEFGQTLQQQVMLATTPAGPAQGSGPYPSTDIVRTVANTLNLSHVGEIVKSYGVTALLKLSSRLEPAVSSEIRAVLAAYDSSLFTEVQTRAVEFLALFDNPQILTTAAEEMPPLDEDHMLRLKQRKADGITPDTPPAALAQPVIAVANPNSSPSADQAPKPQLPTAAAAPAKPAASQNLIDFDPGAAEAPAAAAPGPANNDILGLLLGGSSPTATPAAPAPSSGLANLLGSNSPSQIKPTVVVAYENGPLKIEFEVTKPVPANPSLTQVLMKSSNNSPQAIQNYTLQVAVPKHLKMQLDPASSSLLSAQQPVTQVLKLANTEYKSKPAVIRLKIDFDAPSGHISTVATPPTIPE